MSDNGLITCERFDERLSDWLEQNVDAGTRAALERHVAGCARCEALLADLAAIRRQAASMPDLVPSRDLWPEIEARIQAPVITLDRSRAPGHAGVLWARRRRWWMGAAAAALVAVTAGVTYLVTTNVRSIPAVATMEPTVVDGPDPLEPMLAEPAAALASDTQSNPAQGAARRSGSSARTNVTEGSEYSRDVAQLRAIVAQRRAELDSTTLAVLEKNLELIDRAIAESRAALQRDPASEFLADQLARAMTKKVAILRTAALLPARS
jgi:hypothetical protein